MTNPSRSKGPSGFRHLDAGLGPALPTDPLAFERVIEQAVDAVLCESRTVERPRKRWPWLALAAIVVASSAGAATVTARHFGLLAAAPHASTNAAGPHAADRKRQPHLPTPDAAIGDDLTVPLSVSSTSTVAPSTAVPSTAAVASTSVPVPSPSVPAAVEDQLAQANLMRQNGRWKEAEVAYLASAKRFAAASEAEVASLAAAALRLEHLADPQGALSLYESVARGGRLNVEALYGVARSQRLLGNQPAEQAALSKVIEQAPQSLQADRARQRLMQLQK